MNATKLRPLSTEEANDVRQSANDLRDGIDHWAHTREFFGKLESDRIRGYRQCARELQHYVRCSREEGIDIMPLLREMFGKAPQVGQAIRVPLAQAECSHPDRPDDGSQEFLRFLGHTLDNY